MASITDARWFQLVIGVTMLGAGLLFTGGFAREILSHRAATAKYLRVEARILSHDLNEQPGVRAGEGASWTPVIVYEYIINGQTYRSENVLPRPTYHTKEWAEEILAKFPIGTVQTAYYDPSQPDQSYLQTTRLLAFYYVALVVGLLFLLLGSAKSIEILWKTFRT